MLSSELKGGKSGKAEALPEAESGDLWLGAAKPRDLPS